MTGPYLCDRCIGELRTIASDYAALEVALLQAIRAEDGPRQVSLHQAISYLKDSVDTLTARGCIRCKSVDGPCPGCSEQLQPRLEAGERIVQHTLDCSWLAKVRDVRRRFAPVGAP